MRFSGWLVLPIVLLLTIAAGVFYFRDLKGTFATSGWSVGLCQSNDAIAEDAGTEIGSTALEFMELFARAPMEARRRMSRRGRSATIEREPIERAHASYTSTETVGPPEVTDIHLLRFASGSETGQMTPCDLSGGRAVFVARGGTMASAVALITEELPGSSQRTTSVWLERESDGWRVRAFSFGLSRINGKSSEQLWEEAQHQRQLGHEFNAAMLYVAARGSADRGMFYQPRMMQDFNADYGTFETPELIRGTPPFTWRFGDETYQVTRVEYMGFSSGDVGLIINHAPDAWTEYAEAEAINRRLIDGFIAAHPDWSETFDAVIARAARPGGNEVWGTVYTKSNGYSRNAATAAQLQ